ncbi:MAG: DegV family EDD domain-containing protein [Acidobacteriia bacterium]|nr:DegV family EDD domain-containing protein [Terriglobia bacterium]
MVQFLTGPRLARALRAGALAVAREQETLNRINVFPVPDADTGANLASTLRAAAAALTTPKDLTVGQTARAAADAALDGARGNSGAIFAQFLHGMAESIGTNVSVTTHEFAAAVRRGADAAQQALAQPVEGTILSVLREWAIGLEEQTSRIHDFGELLGRSLDRAREALANTPRQLAVLAKHGVVDAGAQGFVYFLEGISTFFRDRMAANWRRAGMSLAQATPFAAAHADLDLTYRYCAEALLTGDRLDRKAIGREVAPLGGSLVVAGGGSRLRVHLHTNEPQRFFSRLAESGTVERTKIDDMVLQQLAARGAALALVTDSSCDMPEAKAHAVGLVRVPLSISFGEETFLDGVDITPPQFYQRLAGTLVAPKTSQPAVGDFRSTFQRLLENHEGVISLHLSAGLSGTYQAALSAARQVDPSRIRVVDTGQVSVALGLVAEAVGEAIAAGKDLDGAVAIAEQVSRETQLFASLASLDLAVRGGRVSAGQARLATLFGLNPLLTIGESGKAEKAGVYLGFAASLRGIVKRAARYADGRPVRLMVAHASAVGAAEYVTERLCSRFGVPDIPIVNLTAVLASHVGPGAVGVAVRRMEV